MSTTPDTTTSGSAASGRSGGSRPRGSRGGTSTSYGPDIATIKGKTTRSAAAAPRAPTFVAEVIPASILAHHCDVTLCVLADSPKDIYIYICNNI